jgi:hypothetical protein
VSDDNPFSEALFRTCKYRPNWPSNGFASKAEAQAWVEGFVRWYNTEHRHSGIRFVTPEMRHSGNEVAILNERASVYAAARGLGLFGMALGYALARLLRQDEVRSRTIALETGIQNGPLAVLIVLLTFQGQMQQDALLIPVLYSLFIVLTSSAVTLWFRRITTREELARDRAKVPVASVAPTAA